MTELFTGHGSWLVPPNSDILVIRDSAMTRHNTPSDHLFSVKFFPGGLQAILGIPQTKFIGAVVPLSQVLPPRLIDQVKSAGSFQQRKTLLEDFFNASLSRRPKKDHYSQLVRDSVGFYENAGMHPNTTQLAGRHFVHSRTINRYFHQVIGLAPKKYFTIVRARAALASFISNRKDFNPEDFGYYDSSHFYKAICQFTHDPSLPAQQPAPPFPSSQPYGLLRSGGGRRPESLPRQPLATRSAGKWCAGLLTRVRSHYKDWQAP
jgi:hypothetical protein